MANDLVLKAKFTADTSEIEEGKNKVENLLSGLGETAVKAGAVMAKGIALASTAIIALTKQSIDAYGSYEQFVGGVETLFKGSADKLLEYAENAWKTQGLSANSYMEVATSFSARLIQGLGDDTDKAVKLTDMAISDIMDNVNKMGTTFESVNNAYQGFAKQNYTMLDNLKLGYGGTASEMARLINDSGVLGDTIEVTAKTVNSVSFDKMIEAINVIQQRMGITGTTALEAEGTITGSMSAVSASWQNLMVGLADDSADIDTLLGNFVNSFATMASNIVPRIQQVLATIPTMIEKLAPQLPAIIESLLPSLVEGAVALLVGLADAIPTLFASLDTIIPMVLSGAKDIISSIATAIWGLITDMFNNFDLNAVTSWLEGIGDTLKENAPIMIKQALPVLLAFSQGILDNVPVIVESGMDVIIALAEGIIEALPALIENVPLIVSNIANTISNSMQIIITKGIELVWALIKGIVEAVPSLIDNFWNIIKAILDVWNAINWIDLGKNLINGIKNGLENFFPNLKEGVKNAFNNIKNVIKEIFESTDSLTATIWSRIKDTILGIVVQLKDAVISKITDMFTNVKTIFANIGNAIKNPIETAKNVVKGIIDTIKGFFKFEWNIPRIELPHFAIKPSGWKIGDLLKGTIPSLSIDWYKNGGILDKPTIFGAQNGKLLGAGEAGAEAVAPLTDLMDYIQLAVDNSNVKVNETLDGVLSILSDYLPMLSQRQMVLDTGAIVGELTPSIDEILGMLQRRKDR